MGGKYEKVDKAFQFFKKMRLSGDSFELETLKDETGWDLSTIRTYVTKRWNGFLDKTNRKFKVLPKFDAYTLDNFRGHHSQKGAVSRTFSQSMLDKSVSACVSAIEVYNKPDFKFREESFSILMINAWELLLKAKIINDKSENLESIQILKSGKPELSASGNPKTISIGKAVSLLEADGKINNIVADNIRLLIEIRDESVHFIHSDLALSTTIQSIGTASLKNFMTLASVWFGYDFSKFNFYLMPISFYHPSDFESFSVHDAARSNFVKYLKKVEREYEGDDDPNFSLTLKLVTKFVKSSIDEAIQVRVTDDPDAPEILVSEEDVLKSYPYTHSSLCELLKKRYKNFKRNKVFNAYMRQFKQQGDVFCKERRLDPTNPNSIYKTFYHSRIIEALDKYYEKA